MSKRSMVEASSNWLDHRMADEIFWDASPFGSRKVTDTRASGTSQRCIVLPVSLTEVTVSVPLVMLMLALSSSSERLKCAAKRDSMALVYSAMSASDFSIGMATDGAMTRWRRGTVLAVSSDARTAK